MNRKLSFIIDYAIIIYICILKQGAGYMAKRTFDNAKKSRNDEFYTQLGDIEAEMRHYKEHFKGKVIFCNCDDPYESNFFKYFAMNFNFLGIKKLITTCYTGSPVAGEQLSLFDVETLEENTEAESPYKVEITEVRDENMDGAIDLSDVEYLLKNRKNVLTLLQGNGDFRSPESIELLKEADIVVTNPPFSLFREYVAQLVKYDKKFIIVGSKNAITYKEIFELICKNEIWLGNGFPNGNAFFRIPDDSSREWANGVYNPETGLVKFRNVGWFTNLDIKNRHESITLYKQYSPVEYPHYDNYDAINVNKVAEIPYDYNGAMGVPITILDNYNPEQFEILGITSGRDEFKASPTKRYINPKQINKNGSITNGSKANTRATLLLAETPKGIHYIADNAAGPLRIVYARILIKRKGIKQ